ncbi:MAG: type IV secretory system conjugative DNA transfer family protein, partial [Phycisphaerales bacterium]|nr:type IV secretory system conjugative DNA transfer family protein [Phycisphaerales bacterium]
MESRLGTAEWEDLDVFVERHRYENGDFWIGRSPKTGEPLGYSDDRHVFLASKSRSGKGTTTIINNLLTWKGSMVVVDPKGENATVTAARRGSGSAYCEGMGQRVFVLDPFGSSSVDEKYRASFNPLDALDPTSKSVIDDAGLIADAIIPERPDAKDPYFDLTARKMLKGLILHVITAPHFEGRRNLMTVRALIRHGERDGLEKLKAFRAIRENDSAKRRPLPSAFQLLWSDVAANDALEGIIAGIGESISNSSIEASKTFDNCLSTLDRHSEFLDSFEMRKVLERSDFRLADLKTDPGGVSLYLCLPQRYTTEHYRWLRLMNTLVITMMEEVKEQPATGHRILMVLDEFLLLEHMKVIERAVPYIAGYGLTMFFVVQSLEHLKKVYRETWETLIANCGIKMFYAVGDHFSRKYISDLIGETEVIRETEGWSEQQGTSESSTQGENRSRTDGISESSAEGRSRSEGQTEQRSSTHGTSQNVSDAVSETRGWSDGESSSKSWNKQRSFTRGTSSNESDGYTPSKLLFRNTERHFHLLRENENKGFSFGKNKGSTFGRSFGRSRSMNSGRSGSKSLSRTTTGGTSHSETSGTSQSITNSESLTETTGRSSSETIGENQSTTEGSSITTGKSGNQTVHKRPLITADEIGRWFARPEPT